MTKTMRIPSYSERVQSIIKEEVSRYCQYTLHQKFRRCLRCKEPFKLKNKNRFYCGAKCGSRSHYISFSIRKILK